MSFVSPVNGKLFGEDRQAYIYAVSRRESSSDLTLSDLVDPNLTARKVHNGKTAGYGFIGYFQFGESALYDLGYFKPPYTFSNDSNSIFQKSFSVNDWSGSWTGLDDVTSKSSFLKDRTVQIKAFNKWINTLCTRLNNQNVNEFYGVRISGVEVTESGCIAGAHLKGPKYVLEFVQGLGNQADAFGTQVGEYISLFAHYDLESCCNRKIYINVVDEQGNAVSSKKIIVESEYKEGKYYSKIGKISNDYKTSEEGKIPVIVRHPSTKIKIIVDGKALEITQQKDKKESYTIKLTKQILVPAVLEQNSTPQPKPQVNKTPQDVRDEQALNITEETKIVDKKDVNFNIQIVEADTGKAISNMNFFLTYKGNIKKHTADSRGIRQGIMAEEGQDVEVSVEGDGQKQVIYHFQVSAALENKTIKVKLPVHSFNISVTQEGKLVPNTLFSLFYRGREIPKRTNNSGVMNVRMLTGFVFGFGIKGKSLVLSRVEKSNPTKPFTVNGSAVQASKLYEVADAKRKQAEDLKKQQQQKEAQERKAKEEAEKAKTEADKKDQTKQNNTYTENEGKPLTTVSDQSPPTSDTTRYHIYHNGQIKRENRAATGFAEFIYYDQNGKTHDLGKSRFIKAPMRKAGNEVISGNCYLIDFTKHSSYRDGNIGYKWFMTGGNIRFYLNGITMSGVLGTFMSLGYEEYPSSGGSLIDGSSQAPSVTHRNGEACDFRYIGKNNAHRTNAIWTQNNDYDEQRNITLVGEFRKFGFTVFYTQDGYNKKPKISGTSYAKNHYHHLHIGTCSPKIEDI